jgi:hypothetical protein
MSRDRKRPASTVRFSAAKRPGEVGVRGGRGGPEVETRIRPVDPEYPV